MEYPIEPPMTLIERDREAAVAISAAGVTLMAIVAAGASTPPTPKPAIAPSATAVLGVSGVSVAREPLNVAVAC